MLKVMHSSGTQLYRTFACLTFVVGLLALVGCGGGDAATGPSSFTCSGDGAAIPIAQRCDGSFDCYDNSDEMGCPVATAGGDDPAEDSGSSPPLSPKLQTPEACGFDPDKAGQQIGDHAANFVVRDETDEEFALHSTCGSGKKALWIILAAQW